MRRPFFQLAIACVAMLNPPLLSAQHLFDLGFKAGVNIDDLSTSYSHSSLVGANAGLFVRAKPIVLPGIQGELLVSTMGTSAAIEGVRMDLRTATLQLPLFLVFAIGPAELHAGGYLDHQLAKSWNGAGTVMIEGNEVGIEDLQDDSYGLLLGLGLHLKQFYAGARYNYGLSAVGTGPYLDDVKNRQIQLYIGIGLVK